MTRMIRPLAALSSLLAVSAAFADEVGYQDLLARLGAAAPTGAGVTCAQVEASESAGNYGPNKVDAAFTGVTFNALSGASGNSSHATYVAYNWYGDNLGMAKGVTLVYLYEAGSFVQAAALRTGQGVANLPLTPPFNARVFNHSWIGSFGSTTLDNEANRRADFAMTRDDTLFICGVNNGVGSALQPLMACNYNGMSVGLVSGAHSAGAPPVGIDGQGRMKPEIVAPAEFTSFSTPVVSGAATLLYETAVTGSYATNTSRRKGCTVKAALMAGATHSATWQNQTPASGTSRGITTKPIDPIYGAGTVNIDRAHRILTADEAVGSATTGGATTPIALRGWDYEVVTAGYQRHYLVNIPSDTTASFTLVWNRDVPSSQLVSGTPPVANLRLELRQLVGGVPTAITGDAGASVFASGNVVSASAADNVEHLYVKGLHEGTYLLSVTREDSLSTTPSSTLAWILEPAPVAGDLNGDFRVDGADLGALLGNWGFPGASDLTGDGTTDGADLGALLGNWG